MKKKKKSIQQILKTLTTEFYKILNTRNVTLFKETNFFKKTTMKVGNWQRGEAAFAIENKEWEIPKS